MYNPYSQMQEMNAFQNYNINQNYSDFNQMYNFQNPSVNPNNINLNTNMMGIDINSIDPNLLSYFQQQQNRNTQG